MNRKKFGGTKKFLKVLLVFSLIFGMNNVLEVIGKQLNLGSFISEAYADVIDNVSHLNASNILGDWNNAGSEDYHIPPTVGKLVADPVSRDITLNISEFDHDYDINVEAVDNVITIPEPSQSDYFEETETTIKQWGFLDWITTEGNILSPGEKYTISAEAQSLSLTAEFVFVKETAKENNTQNIILSTPSNAAALYYLNPSSGYYNSAGIWVPGGSTQADAGQSVNNSQLRLENAIKYCQTYWSSSGIDILFERFFLPFDTDGFEDKTTEELNYSGKITDNTYISMHIDPANYTEHMFQIGTMPDDTSKQRTYNLSDMILSRYSENVGVNLVRFVGGKASLNNVKTDGNLIFELDKYFGTDKYWKNPLTITNPPANNIYTLQMDLSSIEKTFTEANTMELPLINISKADYDKTKIDLVENQKQIFDLRYEEDTETLFIKWKISYDGNYVFLSPETGNDGSATAGQSHITPAKTLTKAIEVAQDLGGDTSIVLMDNNPIQINSNVTYNFNGKQLSHWNGVYYAHNGTSLITYTIPMDNISIFNVVSGGELHLQNGVVNGNKKSIILVNAGSVYVEGTTLQNAILDIDSGAAIYATSGAKVYVRSFTPTDSNASIPSKLIDNYANQGAAIYAKNSNTVVNVDEEVECGVSAYRSNSSLFYATDYATYNFKNGDKWEYSNSTYYVDIDSNSTCNFEGTVSNFKRPSTSYSYLTLFHANSYSTINFRNSKFEDCEVKYLLHLSSYSNYYDYGTEFNRITSDSYMFYYYAHSNGYINKDSTTITRINNCTTSSYMFYVYNYSNSESYALQINNCQAWSILYVYDDCHTYLKANKNSDKSFIKNCTYTNYLLYLQYYVRTVDFDSVEIQLNKSASSSATRLIHISNPQQSYEQKFVNCEISYNEGKAGVWIQTNTPNFSMTGTNYHDNGKINSSTFGDALFEVNPYYSSWSTSDRKFNFTNCSFYNNIATSSNVGLKFDLTCYYVNTRLTLDGVKVESNTTTLNNGFAGIYIESSCRTEGSYNLYKEITIKGSSTNPTNIYNNVCEAGSSSAAGLYIKTNSNSTANNAEKVNASISYTNIIQNKGNSWKGLRNDISKLIYGSGVVLGDTNDDEFIYHNSDYPIILSEELSTETHYTVDYRFYGKSIRDSLCVSPANPIYSTQGITDVSMYVDNFTFLNVDSDLEIVGFDVGIYATSKAVWLDGKNGKDTNPGTSSTQPVKTFNRAKEVLKNQMQTVGLSNKINVINEVSVTDNVSIDGNLGTEASVVATKLYRFSSLVDNIFKVSGSGAILDIKNVEFHSMSSSSIYKTSGKKLNGGGIYVSSGATLNGGNGVSFYDENAYCIESSSSTINLTNTSISNCTNFNDQTSYNNYYNCAPFYASGGKVTLNNCIITNNEKYEGTIKLANGCDSTLTNCSFTNNLCYSSNASWTTSNENGILYITGNCSAKVSDCNFQNNYRYLQNDKSNTVVCGTVWSGGSGSENLDYVAHDNAYTQSIDVENVRLWIAGTFTTGISSAKSYIKIRQTISGDAIPVELKADEKLDPFTELSFNFNSAYVGKKVLHANSEAQTADSVIDCFKLDNACLEYCPGLIYNKSENALYARTKHVYLDGANGDDTHSGTNSGDAVKTFAKAKTLLKSSGGIGSNIVLCGTMTITSSETWSLWDEWDSVSQTYVFKNNAGQTWQPILQKDGKLNGSGHMIYITGENNPVFTITKMSIDGNKDCLDTWSQSSMYNGDITVSGCTNGATLNIGDAASKTPKEDVIFKNFYYRVINFEANNNVSKADMNNWKLNLNNFTLKDSGDGSTNPSGNNSYAIRGIGAMMINLDSCYFNNNFFTYTLYYYYVNSTSPTYDVKIGHIINFNKSDFIDSYGQIVVNCGYYVFNSEYDNKTNITNCNFDQERKDYISRNNVRYIHIYCERDFLVDGCTFNVGNTGSSNYDQCIRVHNPDSTSYGNVKNFNLLNSKITNFASYYQDRIYIAKSSSYASNWKGEYNIRYTDFENCYCDYYYGNYLIYFTGSGYTSSSDINSWLTLNIHSCNFNKGTGSKSYFGYSLVYCNYANLNITGEASRPTIFKDATYGYSSYGSIYHCYGCLNIDQYTIFDNINKPICWYAYSGSSSINFTANIDCTIQNWNGSNSVDNITAYAGSSSLTYKPKIIMGEHFKYINNNISNRSAMNINGLDIEFKPGCEISGNSFYRLLWAGNQNSYFYTKVIVNGGSFTNNLNYNSNPNCGCFFDVSEKCSVEINGGNFENNKLISDTYSYYSINGGIVYCENNNSVVINGGTFKNNYNHKSAYVKGAIVYSLDLCNVEVNGGNFINNGKTDSSNIYSSDAGGLFYVKGSNLKESNLVLKGIAKFDGSRSYYGGLVYVDDYANFTIDGDVTVSNFKATFGGAIYTKRPVTIMGNAKISQCSSTSTGGAIFTNSGKLLLSGSSSITNCSSVRGGAIYASNELSAKPEVVIEERSSLNSNMATSNGAGVYICSDVKFSLMDTAQIINNNKLAEGQSTNCLGGGLYFDSYGLDGTTDKEGALFYGGYITGNTAKQGGAIYANRAISFYDVVIQDNISTDNALYTDDIHSNKYTYIFGNSSNITDSIYLANKNYPIAQMQSFTSSNKYVIKVSSDSTYGYEKSDVVVTHKLASSLSSISGYISYYGLDNENFVLVSGEDDNFGSICLGVNYFVDGENGKDTNSGVSPKYPFKTIDKAKSEMSGVSGTIYICGQITIDSDYDLQLKKGQEIARYSGFPVGGESYTEFTKSIFNITDGTLTTGSTVTINGLGTAYDSLIKVSNNAKLLVNGSTLTSNNNTATDDLGSGFGGAIYSEGSVELTGSVLIDGCGASEGSAIYHNGSSLVLSDNPNIFGEVYLAPDESSPRIIYINDSASKKFSVNHAIHVDMEDSANQRCVVDHAYDGEVASLSDFELDSRVSSVYVLVNDAAELGNLKLEPLKTVYVDGNRSTDGSGVTADDAYNSLISAYQALNNIYGMIVVVNPIKITNDIHIYNDGLSVGGAGKLTTKGTSIRRYSQPQVESGFSSPTNKNELFIVENGGVLTLESVSINGHSVKLESDSPNLTADAVVDAKAIVDVKSGGHLNITGSGTERTLMFENDTAEKGGSVYVESGGYADFDHAIFRNTKAKFGGAAYIEGNTSAKYTTDSTHNTIIETCEAEEAGGAFYIAEDATLTTGVNFTIQNGCIAPKGSAIYQAGTLNMSGRQTIYGEVYYVADKHINVTAQFANAGLWTINLSAPDDGSVLAEGEISLTGYIETFSLNSVIASYFSVDYREGTSNKIIELQMRYPVYVDGVNGNDSNDGLSPDNAVKTLAKAYEILSVTKISLLYVCGQVDITSGTSITSTKYSGSDSSYDLENPISIYRYSKPDRASELEGFTKDTYKGPLFNITGKSASLSIKDLVVDGHKDIITTGSRATKAPGVESNSALINLSSGSSLNLIDGSVLTNNNNVSSDGLGGAVYALESDVIFNGTSITENNSLHGSAVYVSGTLSWSRASEIGEGEIYLKNYTTTAGIRGSYIDLDISSPNGIDEDGEANKINVDIDTAGYSQNKRVIAKYATIFSEDFKDIFLLKSSLPSNMVYMADSANKQIVLMKKFTLEVDAFKDNVAAYSGKTLQMFDSDGTQLAQGTLDGSGKISFSPLFVDGTYTAKLIDASKTYEATDVVVNDENCIYQFKTFTVQFNENGHGEAPDSQVVLLGDKATSPEIEYPPGYTFAGWYTDQECSASKKWDFNTNVVQDSTTLYASWVANKYTINFDKQGGSGGSSSATATYDSDMPSISIPSKSGQAFLGYYDDNVNFNNKYYNFDGSSYKTWNKTSNSTLYAKWGEAVAQVTIGSTTINYGSLTDAFASVASSDNATVRLLSDVNEYGIAIPTNRNITLDLNGYKVNGQTKNTVFYAYGNFTIDDTSASGNGQILNGASEIGGCIFLMDNSIVTLNNGTISGGLAKGISVYSDTSKFIMNGGKITNCSSVENPACAAIYVNGSCEINGGTIDNMGDNTAAIMVTSDFIGREDLINVNGGVIIGDVCVLRGTTKEFDAKICRIQSGWTSQQIYSFDVTDKSIVAYSGLYTPTQDLKDFSPDARATWTVSTADFSYSLKYQPGTYSSGDEVALSLPKSVDKFLAGDNKFSVTDGYHFVGWKKQGGTKVYKSDEIIEASTEERTTGLVLISVNEPNVSSVKLDHNDGTLVYDTVQLTYAQAGSSVTPPTRIGYTFDGYFDSNDKMYFKNTGEWNTGTWDKPEVNVTLYAHWTANTYTLKLKDTFGSGYDKSLTVTYDSVLPTVTDLPTRENYKLKGFYTAETGGQQRYLGTGTSTFVWNTTNNDTIFYAQWDSCVAKNITTGQDYLTLVEAIENASDNNSIQMITDTTESNLSVSSKKLNLDLNGREINGGAANSIFVLSNSSVLTITSSTDKGRLTNGKSSTGGVASVSNSTLSLSNVAIQDCSGTCDGIYLSGASKLVLENTNITCNNAITLNSDFTTSGSEIKSGIIKGNVSGSASGAIEVSGGWFSQAVSDSSSNSPLKAKSGYAPLNAVAYTSYSSTPYTVNTTSAESQLKLTYSIDDEYSTSDDVIYTLPNNNDDINRNITLSANPFVLKQGCLFDNWKISSSTYKPGEVYSFVGNTDAVAQCHWKTTAITFDKNTGTGGDDGTTGTFSKNMPTVNTPTTTVYDGYNFFGYFDTNGKRYYKEDGTSACVWDKEDASVTLVAHWIKIDDLSLHFDYGATIQQALNTLDLTGDISIDGEVAEGSYVLNNVPESEPLNYIDTEDSPYVGNVTFTITSGILSSNTIDTEVDVTVDKRIVELYWGTQTEFTYNGTEQAPSCIATNLSVGDKIKVVVQGAIDASNNPYTARAVSLADDESGTPGLASNYKLLTEAAYVTKQFKINKKSVNAWASGANNKVYDGNTTATASIAADTTMLVEGESISFNNIVANFQSKDVAEANPVTVKSFNYSISGGRANSTNYAISLINPTFEGAQITKKTIGLDWGTESDRRFKYDGTKKLPVCNATDLVDGEVVKVVVVGEQVDCSSSYTATASSIIDVNPDIKYAHNYKLPEERNTTFEIYKCNDMAINILGGPFDYTGQQICPDIDIMAVDKTTKLDKNDFDIVYGENIKSGTNSGSITITAKETCQNYTGSVTAYFSIGKIDLSSEVVVVTKPANLVPYNGQKQGIEPTIKYKDNTLVAGVDFQYTWTNDTNASTENNEAVLTINQTENDDTNYVGQKIVYYHISRYKDGVTDASAFDVVLPTDITPGLTYDGNEHAASAQLKEEYVSTLEAEAACGKLTIYYQKKISEDGTYSERTTAIPVDAGNYKVTLDVSGGQNFSACSELEIGNFEIKKVALDSTDVTIDDINLGNYDGNAKNIQPVLRYKGMQLTLNKDFTYSWLNNIDATTADTKAKLTVNALDNLACNYSGSNQFSYEISKYNGGVTDINAFDVTIPKTLTYDGASHPATVTLKSIYAGHTLEPQQACGDITLYYAKQKEDGSYDDPSIEAPVNAGNYQVTFDVAGGQNFASASNIYCGSFTINKKQIDDNDVLLGAIDLGSYDASTKAPLPVLTYNNMNLQEGIDFNYSWSNNVNASTDMVKASLTISAVNSFNCNYFSSRISNHVISQYKYGLTDIDAFDFTLPKNPDDSSVIYDGNPHAASASLKSIYSATLAQGIACGSLTLYYQKKVDGSFGERTTEAPVDAGTYRVTLDISGGQNFAQAYELECGTFDIVANEAELDWSDLEFTYDGNAHKPNCTVVNLIGTDTCEVTVEGEQINASPEKYTANAVALSNPNYSLPNEVTQQFQINQRAVSASNISSLDKIYDQTDVANLVLENTEFNNIVSGDTIVLSNVTGTYDDENVGEDKTVHLDYSAHALSNSNYVLDIDASQQETTSSILPMQLTEDMIELDHVEFKYDGQAHKPEVVIIDKEKELVEGEDYEIICTAQTAIGKYVLTVVGLYNYEGDPVEFVWDIIGDYIVLSGMGGSYEKHSNVTLPFECNGNVTEFKNLSVDGVAIDASSFTYNESKVNNKVNGNASKTEEAVTENTKVELLPTYMDSITTGSHTLTFNYENGGSASCDFTITEVLPVVATESIDAKKLLDYISPIGPIEIAQEQDDKSWIWWAVGGGAVAASAAVASVLFIRHRRRTTSKL